MDKERRRSKRKTLIVEVDYEGAGVRSQTRISDISTTGVFVDTLSPLPDRSKVKLTFKLPDGYVVHTGGVVTHSQPGIGMGIAFTSLAAADADRIQELVDGASDKFW